MNLVKDAAAVLQTVAPKLGLALGGPLGGMAGGLLSMGIGKLLGKQDAAGAAVPATQKEIETELISGDPQTLLAVKTIEADLTKHMADLGVQEEQLSYQDIANARGREIVVRDWTPRILAYVVVAITLLMEGLMMIYGQPKGMDGVVLGRILGAWDSATMLVLSYYFGSSVGSKDKDTTLANLAKGNQ